MKCTECKECPYYNPGDGAECSYTETDFPKPCEWDNDDLGVWVDEIRTKNYNMKGDASDEDRSV